MKLSWSHKLFFQANRLVGRSLPWDGLIRFVAEYLIFGLIGGVYVAIWLSSPGFMDFLYTGAYVTFVVILGLALSFGFAWLWPHPRPKVEFPEIRELITPLSRWKSLPSDHSIIVWVLTVAFWQFTEFGVFYDGLVALAAAIIGVSRIVAGVHYPRDIVAGAGLALGLGYLFF